MPMLKEKTSVEFQVISAIVVVFSLIQFGVTLTLGRDRFTGEEGKALEAEFNQRNVQMNDKWDILINKIHNVELLTIELSTIMKTHQHRVKREAFIASP